MNIVERAKAPTPKFFKILRAVGLALLAISGSVIAAPVVLPAAVVTVAGYLAVAGGVISAVSQMTVSPLTPEGGTKVEEENPNKSRDGD
jgi:ABC-type xylose transport system permease subunit